MIGWTMVIALPDRGNTTHQESADTEELTEL